jgi:hypothetical protein
LNALYHEFAETGVNEVLGYSNAADLADHYPRFFWSKVEPFLPTAVHALRMTTEGRQWLSNLYAHVCIIEHGRLAVGPSAGPEVENDALSFQVLSRRTSADGR